MGKQKIDDDEKQKTDQWLITAHRFLALSRGFPNSCKRRPCIDTGTCHAHSLNPNADKNACGLPLQKGDIAQTIQLALFGMMIEEGLFTKADEATH